jgi:hypothetical protein
MHVASQTRIAALKIQSSSLPEAERIGRPSSILLSHSVHHIGLLTSLAHRMVAVVALEAL